MDSYSCSKQGLAVRRQFLALKVLFKTTCQQLFKNLCCCQHTKKICRVSIPVKKYNSLFWVLKKLELPTLGSVTNIFNISWDRMQSGYLIIYHMHTWYHIVTTKSQRVTGFTICIGCEMQLGWILLLEKWLVLCLGTASILQRFPMHIKYFSLLLWDAWSALLTLGK